MKNKKKSQINIQSKSVYCSFSGNINNLKENTFDRELYRDWRKTQRDQLGISANLYMIFASAILGYVVNFIVTNKNIIDFGAIMALLISLIFLLLSLIFYGCFTHNRLTDFRKTAKLIKKGKTEDEVAELTTELGDLTWNLYNFQRYCLIAGFFISLIGFSIYVVIK